jgi:hypothetical protein
VAVLLVAVLAGLSLGTGLLIIRHFRADATATSRLYSGVFGGLNDPDPDAEAEALLRLGEQVRALGLPLIVTDRQGKVSAVANLPFEAALEAAPGLTDIAVFGRPDDRWCQRVCAAYTGTVTEDELRELAATRLSPPKRPKEYERLTALPRTATGKVRRTELI